ncbi:MAG: succinate dehydrogenase cytochrome b subunit [Myxococcales bacterium]|nr:succinate dehydrogenase cytochrome b subunit [Polyangiaceae bacterium]MDW8250331.1 succinate dehydrogenase cytochrome b subunit [Myxococcales bacterium]
MLKAEPLPLLATGIGKKAVVAITGLVLYGFVFVHALGNLQVFLGREAIKAYRESLHSFPKALWGARAVLLVCLLTHVTLTIDIAAKARAARTTRYKVSAPIAEQGILQRYARKTMVLSGPILLVYIMFHLAHLTAGVVPGLPFKAGEVYDNLVRGFQNPMVAGLYIVANLLLGLHLYHGGVALFQTLGLRHPQWDAHTRHAAFLVTAVVTATNVIIPTTIAAGLIRQ